MNSTNRTLMKIVGLIACTGLILAGCTASNTDETSTATASLTVAGSLGGAQAKPGHQKIGTQAVTYTDYSVRCTTLTGTPKAGTGTVNADGSFSLTIDVGSSESVPIGCFVIATVSSSIAATFAFDSGSSGIGASGNGETSKSGSLSAGAGETLNFGTITFDPDKGTATVSTASITRAGTSHETVTGTWTDPTGQWTMTCKTDSGVLDDDACPQEGMEPFDIYLHQMEATDASAVVHKGLSVWENATSYAACGSTEDLDAELPSGWSAVDATLNADFTIDAIPAASSVSVPSWGGSGTCGVNPTTVTTCDQVTNVQSWGNGTITYSDADCQAMCVAESLWNTSGSCRARYYINFSYTQGAGLSPGDIATEVASFNGTTGTTTNGYITRSTSPEVRYAIGELTVNGNFGTMLSSQTQTMHFCQWNENNGGCTDRTCVATENVKMDINQTSATAAEVEVVISWALDVTNSDAACSQQVSGNYLYEEMNRTNKFQLSAVKQ